MKDSWFIGAATTFSCSYWVTSRHIRRQWDSFLHDHISESLKPPPKSNPPLPPWICGTTAQHHCRKVLGISMQLCHWACADVSITLVSMETSSSPHFFPSVCISSVNPRVFSAHACPKLLVRGLHPCSFCFFVFRVSSPVWISAALTGRDDLWEYEMTAVFPSQMVPVHLENQLCGQRWPPRSVWTNPARLNLLLSCSLVELCCGQLVCSSPRACGRVSVDVCLWISVGMPTRWLSPPPISSCLHSTQRQWSSVVVWFWSWLLSHIVSCHWRVCSWCFSLVNS